MTTNTSSFSRHLYSVPSLKNPACSVELSNLHGYKITFLFFFLSGDGSCFYSNQNLETLVELCGSDCDPLYKVVSDSKFVYTACRDSAIRKYCLQDMNGWACLGRNSLMHSILFLFLKWKQAVIVIPIKHADDYRLCISVLSFVMQYYVQCCP